MTHDTCSHGVPYKGDCTGCSADEAEIDARYAAERAAARAARIETANTAAGYTREYANGWRLTTRHPASSHGIPVLIDPGGTAYGPGDPLTANEVAEMFGVTRNAIGKRIAAGTLPASKLGRDWLILAEEAVRWRPMTPGVKPANI